MLPCVCSIFDNITFYCLTFSKISIFHFKYVVSFTAIPQESVLNEMTRQDHFYATKGKAKAGPMLPETKKLLVELYQPYVNELAKFLKDDRYYFKDVSFR